VSCAGGSWLAPEDAMVNGEWNKITELTKQAIAGVKKV
jgi:2-dehydro-3-deoxyphosphogluconate aldolase/(4S)-4-hydroxy-2-oxoglutarate aldolase